MTVTAAATETARHEDDTRSPWSLERLVPSFAARIHDVDLREVALDGRASQLRGLLAEHKVLFFAEQRLDNDAQVALGRALGELTVSHPVVAGATAEHPEIYALDSFDGGRSDVWHTDVTFMPRPPMASILRAVNIPDVGGNTNWVDLEAAYASLHPGLQRLADELTAEHDGSREFAEYLERRGGEGNEWDGERVRQLKPVPHPVVRVHPETGRRSLFVNPGFTTRILGVSDAESRGLLDAFFAHITRPEHLVRHRWRAGDVVMWDNRSTAHYADFNYADFRRVMHRITLRGDVPVGPLDPVG
ncbi:TauD/TfdA dioxygenase family protein [uncultured Jatrophihabitans sp.]|uniref:TauD/TfdA dioxygenase family protein n=1 Tax=uncultured Jatrophihabitans sp. TaxID=1610747 RepID=UPI0035CA7824